MLQVISRSPTDVQPVLDVVGKAALRFCGANDVLIALRDGDDLVNVAHHGPLPEDIMAVLAEFHGAVGPLIREHEGTLDRFTGDGMLVFFNDPLPCPDAPERAARLALEMRDAVTALTARWAKRGHRLGFGIGMAQGYATLGRIGFEDRFDYTAIGAVINLAARLCTEAADGQVLMSGRLAAAIESLAEMEDLGERALRGMARPTTVANLRKLRA